ncbi:MAG TPA: 2-phospho-L-lactate transferase CofD family protein [Candidatus Saccharimonadales bacterium]|nr:2-phospho-L-lactate transferase CofD family protein [Candidatus Saccharimonadales bacterium]
MASPEQADATKVAIFGGGGGGSVMAAGLVEALPNVDISVIVPTGDSGSKTGELREQFGGPAVGDARKVLAAVAGNQEAGELFGKRFARDDTLYTYTGPLYDNLVRAGKDPDAVSKVFERTGELVTELYDQGRSLKGHTLGNLILTAMSHDNNGDITPGIRLASSWLDARAQVIPATAYPHNVMMHDPAAGLILKGEGIIDDYTPADPTEVSVWLEPSLLSDNRRIEDLEEIKEALLAREAMRPPRATREAIGAIAAADVAILAPGSPWTSHMPALLPRGIARALEAQGGHGGLWVAVANLVEEKPGLDLGTHMDAIHSTTRRRVTHIIHNTATEGLPEGSIPLRFDSNAFDLGDAKEIGAALVDSHIVESDPNDPIAHLRSPGHHDVWKVANVLRGLVVVE